MQLCISLCEQGSLMSAALLDCTSIKSKIPLISVVIEVKPVPEIRLKREELIRNVMSKVKALAQRFDNREPELEELKEIRDLLVSITAYPELFPDMHFPAPEGDEIETLYEVSIEEDQSNALYV